MSPAAKALILAALDSALIAVLAIRASGDAASWPRAEADAAVLYPVPNSSYVNLSVRVKPAGFPERSTGGRCRPEIRLGELTCVYDPDRGSEYVSLTAGPVRPNTISRDVRLRVPADTAIPQAQQQLRIEIGLPDKGPVRALRIIRVGPRPSLTDPPR